MQGTQRFQLCSLALLHLIVVVACDSEPPTESDEPSGREVVAPAGWFANTDELLQIGLDFDTPRTGDAAAYIASIEATPPVLADIAVLGQNVLADSYRGERVRLTAWVHYADVEASDPDPEANPNHEEGDRLGVGLWMRVDGPEATVGLDNMLRVDRVIIGTSDDWEQKAVVLDVPDDAVGITFGLVMSAGRGDVIVDDFQLEIVDDDAESTNLLPSPSPLVYADPDEFLSQYFSAPDAPVNGGFEDR